jgi:hypothetical protein
MTVEERLAVAEMLLLNVVKQACSAGDAEHVDSLCCTAYAEAIKYLHMRHLVTIIDQGPDHRMVVARPNV